MPHLARLFIKLLPIVAATAVAACALGAPSDALAGNNGQQIELCPNLDGLRRLRVRARSQPERRHDRQPHLALGEASNDIRYQTGCRTINGYWWAGTVNVYWYRSDGRLYTRDSCVVPRWNPFTDSKTCTPGGG